MTPTERLKPAPTRLRPRAAAQEAQHHEPRGEFLGERMDGVGIHPPLWRKVTRPRLLHVAVTRIGALLRRRVENPGRDAGQLIRRATPLARVERLRRRVEVRGITREAILPRGPVAAPERDVVIVRDGTALKPIRKTCRAAAPR